MMVKRFVLVLILLFSISYVSSLGISPAIKNINFEPGKQVNITFYILDAVNGAIYDVVLRGGELANYSFLSTNQVEGGGAFVLTINFPLEISTPGEHSVSVGVKERPSETSFISTLVEIGSVVKTFVPYPGYYGDLSLNIPDVNIHEQIPVELHITNRGDNPLEIREVFVEFIEGSGEIVEKLNFTPATISVSTDRYFRKYLSPENIGPGNYIGRAKVSYQDINREINRSFRVGSLFVNITNYTDSILGKGIQKFYVTLESKWNSPVYGAYVDVNLSNGQYSALFRTPSIDISPWDSKTIESYIDTENLDGFYNISLNASYHGQSTLVRGTLFIGQDYRFIVIYSASALLALIFFTVLYIILKRIFFKNKKR